MKVKINYFKPSGKWYIDEITEIPEGTFAWDFRKYTRIKTMIAVTEGETPWGFPACAPVINSLPDFL